MLEMCTHIVQALRTTLTGMRITGKYFRPGTEVTRQYPEEPALVFERTRGRLALAVEKCTACTLCAKACPVECIVIESEKKLEKKGKRPAVFRIDFARCLFCGLCVEACPTQAIVHTGACDFSTFRCEELLVDYGSGFYTEEEKRLADGAQQEVSAAAAKR